MNFKVKKGDAVILQQRHSYHDNKLKRHEYVTYQVAKATSVDRKGIVTGVQLPHGEKPALLGSYRILTVVEPDKQAAARRILETVRIEDNVWHDAEKLKADIVALCEQEACA